MNDLAKNLLLWVVVAVVLMLVFQSFSPKTAGTQPLTYDQFVQEVQGNRVAKVNIGEDRTTIQGERKDGSKFTTYSGVFFFLRSMPSSLRTSLSHRNWFKNHRALQLDEWPEIYRSKRYLSKAWDPVLGHEVSVQPDSSGRRG